MHLAAPFLPRTLQLRLLLRVAAGTCLALAAVSMSIPGARADDVPLQFPNAAEQARYDALISTLRCLVCQNQTLADSEAGLAQDLRKIIHDRIIAGQSDEQIKRFLVARYGDFVLYRPPLQENTWLLWFGPFLLLLAAAFVWWRVARRRIAPAPLDAEQQRRVEHLLDTGAHGNNR